MTASPDTEWLVRQIAKLTTRVEVLSPSQWTEKKRVLPSSASSMWGLYRFDVTPYWREVIDCMSPESDVRHCVVRKGVQVGATTILESVIGFYIAEVRTAPMMLITADSELAKIRMESFVVPMLQQSGLERCIQSHDETNYRKTGRTDLKWEFEGGGFLIPLGAQNAAKLRSVPIRVLLRDELDAWPDAIGKDGDPVKLSMDRTAAYEGSRKIFDCSTPLVKGSSKIEQLYQAGDQRQYMVRCLSCGFQQALRWRRTDDAGKVTGIVWEMEAGRLVPGSVRYLCESCGHPHTNEDKTRLFADDNAEWVPTAVPRTPHYRSYALNALYSPAGMQSWEACAQSWLEAWDEEHGRSRDNAKLQVFHNNVLGTPFEQHGQPVRFEVVSSLRRHEYVCGQLPNKWATEVCGSPIQFITCGADVHDKNLAVAVYGWTRHKRAFLLDYWRLKGNTQDPYDTTTWGRLADIIDTTEYVGDDGQAQRIRFTAVDASYETDIVHNFCDQWRSGVYPIRGRRDGSSAAANAMQKEFWAGATLPSGLPTWRCDVTMYKDRISAALRRQWDGLSQQPEHHFNFPLDISDDALRELTAEVRREKIEKASGKRLGFEWHRPSHAPNELFDTSVYCCAALDIAAYSFCSEKLECDLDWDFFWGSFQ